MADSGHAGRSLITVLTTLLTVSFICNPKQISKEDIFMIVTYLMLLQVV